MVNIWVTYCGPCLSETQIQTAQDIVAATHADYLHLLPSDELAGILYQTTSVPTTFFVDQNGVQVGYAYVGSLEKADWAAIIDDKLAVVNQ